MIHVLLATGYEEIEAVTTIDILRRCGLPVQTCSVTGTRLIHGAHNLPVMADALFRKSTIEEGDCIVLPGGMPGTNNLWASESLKQALVALNEKGILIAAICAAPMILGKLGILNGKNATCYPGFEEHLLGASVSSNLVVEDGNIITGRGPGAAAEFAFAIARRYLSAHDVEQVRLGMIMK